MTLLKKYTDEERKLDRHCKCYDCELPYDSDAWCDVIVPHNIWEMINPTYHVGAGLLCFNCITLRLVTLGLQDVPILITSGPYDVRHVNINNFHASPPEER